MRMVKVTLGLAILGVAGLAVFAYLGDLRPEPRELRQPLTLPAASPGSADTGAPADATGGGGG